MQTTHDDRPHPIPPYAYIRYKENWFFIVIDPAHGVMGMAHFSYEPLFDRARVSCNLLVDGELHQYSNAFKFPDDFAYSATIGDDRLRVDFVEAHKLIKLSLDSDSLWAEFNFEARSPTFNYELADAANPEAPTSLEVIGYGVSPIFTHHQQASRLTGRLTVKATGKEIDLDGLGYRDHSRGSRCDNFTLDHYWSCLQFDDRVFGLMHVRSVFRPETVYRAGYVWDSAGLRALASLVVEPSGETAEGIPETVTFRMRDVYGQDYKVSADIGKRLGAVPLDVEAANSTGRGYRIFENFVDIVDQDTGARGLSLLEIGYSTKGGAKA